MNSNRFRYAAAILAGATTLLTQPIPSPAAESFVAINPPGFDKLPRQSSQVVWGDYDNDGLPDAYVVQQPIQAGGPATTNLLVRNLGDGTFVRLPDETIGGPAAHRAQAYMADWGDLNNDGRLDLVVHTVTAAGPPPHTARIRSGHLYLNQPDGRFTVPDAGDLSRATSSIGSSSSFADYDQDGWLDVFLSSGGSDIYNTLLHARGDGAFTRITDSPITSDLPKGSTITGLWTDMDGDGDQDLIVAQYWTQPPCVVYRNEGAGQFTRHSQQLIEATLGVVNVAAADFDRDGDLDLVAAGSEVNVLLNPGDGAFSLSQHFNIQNVYAYPADYDNDGDIDILFAGVLIEPTSVRLLSNDGTGRFTEVTEAFTGPTPAGGQWVDFDNDGFLDLSLGYQEATHIRHVLYKSQGNGNHWIKFRLVGTASNRSAFGAKVRVKATLGGQPVWQLLEQSYTVASGDALRLHFGLGDATVAEEVRVEWPSGNVQVLQNVPADQIHTVTEPVQFQPQRPVATINGTVTVTNVVPAVSRQWYFAGQPLEGQTGRVLTLTNAQPQQTGRYTVVSETASGTQTHHVFLRVTTQFTRILEGEIVTEALGSQTANWFDLDNDGYLDVLIGNSTANPRNSLFRNNRDGTFTALTDSPLVTHTPGTFASSAVDYDNDGRTDIFEPHWDHNDLWRNRGDGVFESVSLPPITGTNTGVISASWADYNRDGHLDLFLAKGYGGEATENDDLLRNNGDGTFTPVEPEEAGLLVNDREGTWGGAWFDFDNDGFQDILVVHGNPTRPRLHRNQRNGTFTRVASGSLDAVGADNFVAIADYDNDGWLDVFQPRFLSGKSALHRNLGSGSFQDVTTAAGLDLATLQDRPGTWVDFDNDGWLDLFVAGAGGSTLYRNRGDGTFQSVKV